MFVFLIARPSVIYDVILHELGLKQVSVMIIHISYNLMSKIKTFLLTIILNTLNLVIRIDKNVGRFSRSSSLIESALTLIRVYDGYPSGGHAPSLEETILFIKLWDLLNLTNEARPTAPRRSILLLRLKMYDKQLVFIGKRGTRIASWLAGRGSLSGNYYYTFNLIINNLLLQSNKYVALVSKFFSPFSPLKKKVDY